MTGTTRRTGRTALPALAAVLTTLAAGCASSTGARPDSRPQQMVENRDIRNEAALIERTVPSEPGEAWAALQEVYADLELEITARDPQARTLAARQNRMRRLGGQPNSHWVNCGSDVQGPVADRSFVTFDLVTWVAGATENTTTVEIQVQAQGRRRDGGSGGMICSSTGKLEQYVHEQVTLKAAGIGG